MLAVVPRRVDGMLLWSVGVEPSDVVDHDHALLVTGLPGR